MDNSTQNIENIISMAQHRSNAGYSPLTQVKAYWDALRGGRIMPNRTEIDPRGIENALEYSFIVERIAPGVARVRVAGSHLKDLMGMEVRGMPLGTLLNAPSRRQISDALEEVFETPAECTMLLQSEASAGKPALEARLLLLPLKSDLGDVSRILGAVVSKGEIGRAPRRFDIMEIDIKPINRGAEPPELQAVETPPSPVQKPVPGFAEMAAKFKGKTQAPRPKTPYLRLVKRDDT